MRRLLVEDIVVEWYRMFWQFDSCAPVGLGSENEIAFGRRGILLF